MRDHPAAGEKLIIWVGSSKRDLCAVYTVRFRRAIYVLHCFQKKSPSGVRTAKHDVELIEKRLRDAREEYEERYGKGAK